MQNLHGTAPHIACCLCGRPTAEPIDGRCLQCLSATVDVSDGIEKHYDLEMCKTCAQDDVYRWFRNPQWVVLEPESAELLSFCVRRIRGLKSVRLLDASWIWQEPHARRLKVKLTVARDVLSGQSLQQSFVVDYTVKTRNCDKCNKVAAKQEVWLAKVQVRQRAEHPRTLLAMEQQMIKRQGELGRAPPMEVKRTRDGLDFHFARRQHAQRFVSLLHSLAPCRSKASSSVVATNTKTGISNVKHTWSVEVAPICRGDLVRAPKHVAGSGWALVGAVGGHVRLIDPMTGKLSDLSAEAYWRQPFTPVASRRQLSTFVVLDVEVEEEASGRRGATAAAPAASALSPASTGAAASYVQAEATVARERDFGSNDITHLVRTHLGRVIEAGDELIGYDLDGMTSIGEAEDAEAPQAVILLDKKKTRDKKSSSAKRESGSARRRRRKGGGEDGSSSICSGTSYQSDMSELTLADGDEAHDGADDFGALGEFMGNLHMGERDSRNTEDDELDEAEAVEGGGGGGSSATPPAPEAPSTDTPLELA